MKTVIVLLGAAAALFGQAPFGSATSSIRVTAQTLSAQTTTAMFGRLPKPVLASAVQACSNAASTLTVPQARVIQQIKATNGYTVLPKDAAIVVVAAAQGRSALQVTLRTATGIDAGLQGLALAKLIVPGTTWGSVLIMAANILQIATPVAAGTIPTHTYLTFASEMLPDPLELPALGCVSGYALVEANSSVKSIDFDMPISLPAPPAAPLQPGK